MRNIVDTSLEAININKFLYKIYSPSAVGTGKVFGKILDYLPLPKIEKYLKLNYKKLLVSYFLY